MARRHKPRHGVVLLVVLTLLTLLIVIGLTFVLLSGTFRRAAEANARQERYGDKPEQLIDRAMYQLVRDTPNASRSVLKGHSLLRDLIGNDGVLGTVGALRPAVPPALPTLPDGEFLTFSVDTTATLLTLFSPNEGHYNGCTLTFLGPGANASVLAESTRIASYSPVLNGAGGITAIYITIEWSAGEGGVEFYPTPNITSFLINGRPFNGTGAGYNTTHLLDQDLGSYQTALLPNYSMYADLANGLPNLGGLDEPWDTVDYQNMFLAMNPPNPQEPTALPVVRQGIIPSFHRPALVNYWLKRFFTEELDSAANTTPEQMVIAFRAPFGLDNIVGTADDPVDGAGNPIAPNILQKLVDLKRAIILRPLPEDHPNFPHSLDFTNTMGLPDELDTSGQPAGQQLGEMIWDVDNDGDGIPDSIWVDIGLPIQTDASGRRYRPLVAILCQDLDGRLNVNAHSNPSHERGAYYADRSGWPNVPLQLSPSPTDADYTGIPLPFAGRLPANLNQPGPLLPRGLGFGPADIYLGHLLGPDFQSVLSQRYQHDISGTTWAGGESNVDDPMSLIKSVGLPFTWDSQYSAYGMPPDIHGIGSFGLNYTGQPLAFYMGLDYISLGDPYELVLNRKSAGYTDGPFTVAELERIMRHDDVDRFSLPNRLSTSANISLDGDTPDARRNRRVVTTTSSHLPAASGMVPANQRARLNPSATAQSNSILELYRLRLQEGGCADIDGEMHEMVPWEVWHGERFNINRLFGNGIDDNGNFVVDEPGEMGMIWPNVTEGTAAGDVRQVPANFRNMPFNYLNDDANIANDQFAPQIYARHLYCLMMLLSEVGQGVNGFVHPAEEAGLTPIQLEELTAHRIAQWAINVVDFRDPDAIMTPFEYDVRPFDADGWVDLDGDPTTIEPTLSRRLVWGTESPELLLTENTAFHDLRVRRTNLDTTGEEDPPDDPFADQYRIPEGSLFLEFYCPRNRRHNLKYGFTPPDPDASFPRELYDVDGNLNLAVMAPAGFGVQMPVWRVAIGETPTDPADTPLALRGSNPDSTTFDPDKMSLITPTDQLNIERYVWFAAVDPTSVGISAVDAQRIFWNRNTNLNALVPPASYLVVGPRPLTHMGSNVQGATLPPNPPEYLPSAQRISLLGNRIELYRSRPGATVTPSSAAPPVFIQPTKTLVAAANPPVIYDQTAGTSTPAWPNVNRPIGLSVSEPLPIEIANPPSVPLTKYYDEPEAQLSTTADPPFPFDAYYNYELQTPVMPTTPFDTETWAPLNGIVTPNLDSVLEYEPQHEDDYKTAFLQRLANPLLPYHPQGNPYITVDWMTIDLTIFNGEDRNDSPRRLEFATRERGRDPAAGTPTLNLWNLDTKEPEERNQLRSSPSYFQFDLAQTLGYLNSTFGTTLSSPPFPAPYAGDSAIGPFPWLAWNNRPFATPLELMQVPASMPSRLLHEFDILQAVDNPYDSSDPNNWQRFRGHFPHLLNFFHASNTISGGPVTSSNFYRLFDYVETPSPFVGAEKWYNPTTFGASNFFYHPPYNHLSRFQDPGRVNINTIFDTVTDHQVWEGLAKGYPAMDPTVPFGLTMFNRIMMSRRGYPATGTNFYELNSNIPTLFGNPFRSADSADLMPLPIMRQTQPVQATLLRADVVSTPARPDALFVPTPTINDPYQDHDRNPYFRYHGMARLSNLVSNNSNVYATWITLGYFEVEPNPAGVDQAHPDGFRLGPELGTDTGEVKRHRGFYIIDRSVPVAFEPGQNHNVDKAVLLRRYIE